MKIGVLTVSDSCSRGEAEDLSGPLLVSLVQEDQQTSQAVRTAVCPDDVAAIRHQLVTWADRDQLDLILTTGGTGFAPRDQTPEATLSVLDKQAPGLVHAMLAGSLSVTPLAALARPAAGVRGGTVIVNLPGSRKAVKECYSFVKPALQHACDLVQDKRREVGTTHTALQGDMARPVARPHVCPHDKSGGANQGVQPQVGGVAGRARQSQWPMVSVLEAQTSLFSECEQLLENRPGQQVLGSEVVGYRDAVGRVLCQDVVAKDPLPPFPASTKDGYAVLSSDGPGARQVRGEASAGCDPDMGPLQSGQVVRINTGAPLPPGADSVVMVEDTKLVRSTEDGAEELEVEILARVVEGQDVRPVGSDISLGEKVLSRGTILGPGEVGVLAAVGVTRVNVSLLPRVGVLSTGNEVQEPGEELLPGHIRDSNKTTLLTLLASQGISPLDMGIARDDETSLGQALGVALGGCDLLVTTGGVSMGDRDLLRQVLVSKFDAKIHFARVNMKPGKPTTFATLTLDGKKKLVIGLPGNPVSATVTCHLYVLPACRKLSGFPAPLPGMVLAKLASTTPLPLDPRPEYLRVQLSFKPGSATASAMPTGNQISSRLASMTNANGLLILPGKTDDRKEAPVGLECDAILIGALSLKL